VIKNNYCLTTVTDDAFITGTLVMIHSFLQHNRWFSAAGGEIVIIHDCLSDCNRDLFKCFKNIRFLQVKEELKERLYTLDQAIPRLKLDSKVSRFYSLEALRLRDYHRLFFIDSDILIMGDLSDLLNKDTVDEDNCILCCGDYYHYLGVSRDKKNFLPLTEGLGNRNKDQVLHSSFNSGFMVIGNHWLNEDHYRGLLDLLSPKIWQHIKAPQTDQVVLNLYFQEHCKILDCRYNFLVPFATSIREWNNIQLTDIKVLHFNGNPKPWDSGNLFKALTSTAALLPFIKLWHQAYLDFLPQFHLQYRFRGQLPAPPKEAAKQ
jgi:lipopolysaccharide biosynthesis glycosyltransferase